MLRINARTTAVGVIVSYLTAISAASLYLPAVAHGNSRTRRASTVACKASVWSAPADIAWSPGLASQSTIAAYAGHTFLIGNDERFFSRVAPEPRLLTLDLSSRNNVGAPVGGKRFLFPLSAEGPRGLYLVWGENAGFPPTVSELWASVLSTASGWTRATRLLSGESIYWFKGAIDRAPGLRGAPTYFTAPILDTNGSGILVIRADSDSVGVTSLRPSTGAVYTGIARNGSGELLLGLIGADQTGSHDVNSVFAMQSVDGGKSWAEPRLINLSRGHEASQVHVISTGPRTWHLLWLQSLSGAKRPDVIRHVVSIDDGRTWSAPLDLSIPDLVTLLRVISDPCGAIQAVVEYHPKGSTVGARVLYARLPPDSIWSDLSAPFPHSTMTDPDLAVGGDGAVTLTALMWLPPVPGRPWVRSVVAKLGQRQ